MATSDLGACEWFVWDLRRSGLIDRGPLDQIVSEFLRRNPRAEAPALAEFLVDQGTLTAFQAERILNGKSQGLVLGPYVLLDAIGAGSMGQVYKATSKNDNNQYAVKVLPRRSMWNVRLARRQVRSFGSFSHPAVVPFVDVGTASGLHYLAWPLAEGQTLESIVQQQGKLDPNRAALYAVQVAQGLTIAHQNDLFHGLVKPSNIMIGSDNQARILDFGIGSLLAENAGESLVDTMSTSNTLTSGLDYSSPESVMDPTNRTPAGDQYSLGCVLYLALTGRVPFPEGSAVEKMVAHQTKDPVPITELAPDVPAGLAEVVTRLMAKTPENRFPGCDELIEALEPFLGDRNRMPGGVTGTQSGSRPGPGRLSSGGRPGLPSRPNAGPSNVPSRASFQLPGHAGTEMKTSAPQSEIVEGPEDALAWAIESGEGNGDTHQPIINQVCFSVTAPAAMRPGQRYALNVWAHLAAHLAEVIARAERAHPGGPVTIHTKSGVRVARGTGLTLHLRIPAFQPAAPDDTDVIEWNGAIGNATFPVHVPPDTSPGSYDGTVLIYAAGFQIAKLHFDLQVAFADVPAGLLAAREVRHKRAFASYASQDRDAVLARIQGIQKVLPELEIFLDVASLRSGEKWADRLEREVASRDVFYLFWSANASASKWVECEWRAALKVRGIDYIDPVPLVDPKTVPPPPELASALHFNDWVLAYTRGAGAPEAPADLWRRFPWVLVVVLVIVIGASMGAGALLALLR